MTGIALDFGGRIIDPGDIVAYPVRRGSKMWLKAMQVSHVDIIRSDPPCFKIVGVNENGKKVRLEKSDRCVILKKGVKVT
jgi:hypothetical protein